MEFLVSMSSCSDASLGSLLSVLRNILQLIQIIGPILAIISVSLHFFQLVRDPDNKKALPKVKNSLIALVVLFLVPLTVDVLFSILGNSTTLSSCWNSANSRFGNTSYQQIDSETKKNGILTNPDDYQKGTPKPSEESEASSSDGSSSSDGRSSSQVAGESSAASGSVVKEEKSDTLKVTIEKADSYYITRVWVKNAYQQLNKYDSPQYGSRLYKPGDLLKNAVSQNGLSSKLVVAFNASGFYLKDTYDSSSVNAYPAYDRTSVGTLVITNGKVVRNAYNYAVKTWYVAGVDSSGTLRIFEDVASKDANAKKKWSQTVIGTIRNTFTFASPLISGGSIANTTTSMPSPNSALKRQAFCQIDKNNFLLITGSNLTRQDLINIMLKNKCQTGTNFDGGGSIALLYKGKNSQTIETIIGNGRALTEVGYFTE